MKSIALFLITFSWALAAVSQPNILLIIGDDVGFSDLSPYGSEVDTPNIQALADEGVVFTNYHTPPACSPSRAQIYTGVDHHRIGLGRWDYAPFPGRDGMPGYEGYLLQNNVTTAELLREAGYHTYIAGKWHQGHAPGTDPIERGFEQSYVLLEGGANNYNNVGMTADWPIANFTRNGVKVSREEGDHSDKYWSDQLMAMIEGAEDEHPFFGVLAFQTVHFPLQAPENYIDRNMERYSVGWESIRHNRVQEMRELGIVTGDYLLPASDPGQQPWSALDEDERRIAVKRMAIYGAMLEHHDYHIGRVIEFLKSADRYENTMIIYVSDNGGASVDFLNGPGGPVGNAWFEKVYNNDYDNLGKEISSVGPGGDWGQAINAPNSWYKLWVREGGTRVPMIIRHPEGEGYGDYSNALVQAMDLAATVLDAAGVVHPGRAWKDRAVETLQGRSLLPIVMKESASVRNEDEPVVVELLGNTAVYMGDWKLLRIRAGMRGNNDWQLFRLSEDPAEANDLRLQQPEVFDRILAEYREYAQNNNIVPVSDDWVPRPGGK
jgi:arylsulfatase A-like enzyme